MTPLRVKVTDELSEKLRGYYEESYTAADTARVLKLAPSTVSLKFRKFREEEELAQANKDKSLAISENATISDKVNNGNVVQDGSKNESSVVHTAKSKETVQVIGNKDSSDNTIVVLAEKVSFWGRVSAFFSKSDNRLLSLLMLSKLSNVSSDFSLLIKIHESVIVCSLLSLILPFAPLITLTQRFIEGNTFRSKCVSGISFLLQTFFLAIVIQNTMQADLKATIEELTGGVVKPVWFSFIVSGAFNSKDVIMEFIYLEIKKEEFFDEHYS